MGWFMSSAAYGRLLAHVRPSSAGQMAGVQLDTARLTSDMPKWPEWPRDFIPMWTTRQDSHQRPAAEGL